MTASVTSYQGVTRIGTRSRICTELPRKWLTSSLRARERGSRSGVSTYPEETLDPGRGRHRRLRRKGAPQPPVPISGAVAARTPARTERLPPPPAAVVRGRPAGDPDSGSPSPFVCGSQSPDGPLPTRAAAPAPTLPTPEHPEEIPFSRCTSPKYLCLIRIRRVGKR